MSSGLFRRESADVFRYSGEMKKTKGKSMSKSGEIKDTDWRLYMCNQETGTDFLNQWGPESEMRESMAREAGWGRDVWLIAPDGSKVLPEQIPESPSLCLDVSLEQARALHRVWRALNDGDCPKCHKFHAATEIIRWPSRIICPSCDFFVSTDEITKIETMFAPAMDAAVAIFEAWREESK